MEHNKDKIIKVLVVDDDEDDYLLIKRVFRQIPDSPYELTWTSSFDEAKQHIDSEKFDIYLLDYQLGKQTGLDLLQYAHPEKRKQPFILLTGLDDRSLERQTSRLAAADYLVKGSFDATLLSRTLYYALERKRFEQQRIESLMELNRSKDEFISIASHQLRTPATAVKQYVHMVLDGLAGEISDNQRKLLNNALESNERQLKTVSDLLKVAQVDAGKLSLHWKETDVNGLIKAVMADLKDSFKFRKQTATYKPIDPPEQIWVDEEIVRMVIENIIENASKYSPASTKIVVSSIDAGDEVQISIADQGVGIEPENQTKLFEKFSRIDNPLSTKVGGTGLGLYWAKKIVDLHGGRIEYKQNKPHGSIFTVYLPKK